MVFDITGLDKIILLQALYAGGSPKGIGIAEFVVKDVHGLTKEQCEYEFLAAEDENGWRNGGHHIDYINGIPIKWSGIQKKSRYHLSSSAYDMRHGNFKVFDILCKTFFPEDFSIVQKSYGGHYDVVSYLKEKKPELYDDNRQKKFSKILKESVRKVHPYGRRYHIFY